MPRSFELNDDILIEIFGYLSACDVLQCRRVSKRMRQVTREHTLWTTIYQRSKCALPILDWTLPAEKLERLVSRAEVVDAKWTNPHPTLSDIHDSLSFLGIAPLQQNICVGIKGPYIIFLLHHPRLGRNTTPSITFHWYKFTDLKYAPPKPLFEYSRAVSLNMDFPSRSALDNGLSYEMDPESGTLYVASVGKNGKSLHLTRIELAGEFETKSEVFQMSVWSPTSPYFGVKIVNGFVLCSKSSWSENQLLEIICVRTGRRTRILLQSKFPQRVPSLQPGNVSLTYRTRFYITPRYLIQVLDKEFVEVFDLPDMSGTTGGIHDGTESGPGASQPSFSGSLPRTFTNIYIFPSPRPATLIIIGARRLSRASTLDNCSVILMTLDMAEHSIGALNEVVISGEAIEADRRVSLVYHPATHCITGIVVTWTSEPAASVNYFTEGPFHDPVGIYQSLKYVKVSLDIADDPILLVNELMIPGRVAEFIGVDVYNGRLMFKYHHGADEDLEFCLLDCLRSEGDARLIF